MCLSHTTNMYKFSILTQIVSCFSHLAFFLPHLCVFSMPRGDAILFTTATKHYFCFLLLHRFSFALFGWLCFSASLVSRFCFYRRWRSVTVHSTVLPSAVNCTGAEILSSTQNFSSLLLGQNHFWMFTDFSRSAFITDVQRGTRFTDVHLVCSHLWLLVCVGHLLPQYPIWFLMTHNDFCDWVIWLTSSFILTSLTHDDVYFTESWDYFFALYWSTINALAILDCISCAF